MISVYKESIQNIPSLIVVDIAKKEEPLPVITYFHGFTSAKEHNLPLAYLLAEKGYRVILPDSKYHGDREVDISSIKLQISFWDIVMQNVKELNDIWNDLEQRGLILDGRFGVAGTSMGGITTSAALTQYPWIKTAAILMGSPKITTYAKTLVSSFKKTGNLPLTDDVIEQLYEQLENLDLSLQPEKLDQRPLLFWHGDQDPTVPFDHSYTFYEDAKKRYHQQDDIEFIQESGQGHKVTRYAILETVKWFDQHL
ncbi:prolyl oligopeptidase family serine peptidase [Ornithinibacillus sp. L9]|uniref:Prolyl oligopeptidase family serine peptidase n=1 Tax=Ornithinibacillus caprae TaxID=2678566 RepID=A0A6N8FMP4_9BACI|nr:prolyl oligopeptidase family serine peptidase [Ornithinibacillus caprae]MUK90603.1 prolyl oligopeptidase family serine peptidase [Ornithinibacillus caprae]